MGEPHRHGTRIIKTQSLPGVCAICCKTKTLLRSFQKDYLNNGAFENYKRMLMTCFNLQLYGSGGRPVEICLTCISRLREACAFRKKVESAGMMVYFKSSKSSVPVVKAEPGAGGRAPYTEMDIRLPDIKQESAEYPRKADQCAKDMVNNKASYLKANGKLLNKSSDLVTRSKEAVPTQLWEKVKSSIHKSLPKIHEKTLNVDNIGTAQEKESASYWGTLEDNYACDNESVVEVSDGESSTTSEQMKTATGYWKELELRKKWTRFVVPRLDFACTTCPVCNEKFETHLKLFPHYENHFPNYVCHVCGLAYVKMTSFTAHIKMHSGIKYPCKLCNRKYASQNGVYAHIKAHHEKVKLFSCYECKERFCNSISRKRHLTTVHGIECPTHPCPTCGKIFFSGHTMRTHIKKTHQKQKNVDCPECDMQFFDKRSLSDHMAKHTGIKNYHCDFCEKAFGRKKNLTEHLKIHNNIKKHICEVCEKAFVQKCALKSHMRVHTKNC